MVVLVALVVAFSLIVPVVALPLLLLLLRKPPPGPPKSPPGPQNEKQNEKQRLARSLVQERSDAEKQEVNSRHAHETLVMDLRASIKSAEEQVSGKSQTKAKDLQHAAEPISIDFLMAS